MTDMISAIYDDAAEYQSLLKHFDEEPSGHAKQNFCVTLGYLDFDHLRELRERKRREQT